MFQSSGECAHFERLPNQTHPIQVKSSLVETPWPKTGVSEKGHIQNVQCRGRGTGLFQRLLTMFHFSSRVEGVVFSQWGYGSDSRARFSWELLGLERELCCLDWRWWITLRKEWWQSHSQRQCISGSLALSHSSACRRGLLMDPY